MAPLALTYRPRRRLERRPYRAADLPGPAAVGTAPRLPGQEPAGVELPRHRLDGPAAASAKARPAARMAPMSAARSPSPRSGIRGPD